MNIAVVGLGKLGSSLLVAIASRGFDVWGVDLNKDTVDALLKQRAPVEEAGLQELLSDERVYKQIHITDLARAVKKADIIFVVVPTPSLKDGSFCAKAVHHVVEEIGCYLASDHYRTVVLVSTVMPGQTHEEVARTLRRVSPVSTEHYGVCYNPEFIALGSVIHDLLNPDFVLVGSNFVEPAKVLQEFYARFCLNQPPVVSMSLINAELTKLSLNCFVTMKICYANMLAELCEKTPGANVDTVTRAIGLDKRIGPLYLKGGTAFGGPCFPRDNLAMAKVGSDRGLELELVKEVHTDNEWQKARLVQLVKDYLYYEAGIVCILGISYKLGTSIDTLSAGRALAKELRALGINVIITQNSHLQDYVDRADIVVIALPDPEYAKLDYGDRLVIDCWRLMQSNPPSNYVPLGVG